MTITINIDTDVSCTNPLLVFYVYRDGQLLDPVSIDYAIYDVGTPEKERTPVKIYPAGASQSLSLEDCPTGARLGLGRYVALCDFSSLSSLNVGKHVVRWSVVKETGDDAETYEEAFFMEEAKVPDPLAYATVRDIRAEGVAREVADDQRVLLALRLGRKYIDRITGRSFEPVYKQVRYDGRGGPMLMLREPIIAIEEILIETPVSPASPLTVTEFAIYNRHIEQNLVEPDDRNNPKVELIYYYLPDAVTSDKWPKGSQNVVITGVFGYTDPDGSAVGCTPEEIRLANRMLAMRELPQLLDVAAREDFSKRWRIAKERTRDQEVQYAVPRGNALTSMFGYFTGDPVIDHLLASYMRPPALGAA